MLTCVAKVSDCLHPLELGRIAKVFDRVWLKILTPNQMLQRLAVALAEVKIGNASENLLTEIC